ncbi:hypothetical protein [Rhodococcus globerulus]|uniref:Uncharacterized protein n=1 Tax=Rhodococcus globerulus TaxID=33008 RepID=A0ABU4C571_RHOGO|nr:hypothetical protein [Rhodococcus globerulus]MDV6271666.1 hypothetical protein [Rhodococcus globerulus]
MDKAGFIFTPELNCVDHELAAELFGDSPAADRKLRAMLGALEHSLVDIGDAREVLRSLYAGPTCPDYIETFLADEADTQDITTHLADAGRSLRAALAILRTQSTALTPDIPDGGKAPT